MREREHVSTMIQRLNFQVVAPRWVRKETPADHSREVLGLYITMLACSVHLCILKVGCSDGFGHSGEVLGLCITGVGC